MTMTAAVIREPGGPEALKLEQVPVPVPRSGQVLIKVRAFGLNRSEMYTRRGESPDVKFPRVLGIEAAGVIEKAPGGEFQPGDTVATAMGGLGRNFDGGYAEYTCVPASNVQKITVQLPWEQLGAMPEMLQTAWGSLYRSLRLQAGDQLLIRGGTTSIGLAAAAIAAKRGVTVASTSRNAGATELLRSAGAHHVLIDDGNIASQIALVFPERATKVLELIGTTTLHDSLRAAREGGIVCMTGIVGNKWSLGDFNPMEFIPTGVCLTSYDGGPADFMRTPLNELAQQVAEGSLHLQIGKVFHLDQIVAAHQLMDSNKAGGKIVVLT